MAQKFYIIDFDSTFITSESLDILAKISLKNSPEKIAQIEQITRDGMVGNIGFRESLQKRLALMSFGEAEIGKTLKILKKLITPSILRNKKFFKANPESIYIISGGFEELILPIVAPFGIKPAHVLANKFIFNKEGKVIGFDTQRPTSKAQGKAFAVASLALQDEVLIVGDGFTDLEVKKLNQGSARSYRTGQKDVIPSEHRERRNPDSIKIATLLPAGRQVARNDTFYKFIAFTENVRRESIIKEADLVVNDFDELLFLNKAPSSVSYPKSRMKVLLLENIESTAVENFKKEGYQVKALKSALGEEDLIVEIKNTMILGIRSKSKVSKNVLKNARLLKAIGTFSIGTDQVDLGSALDFGIPIFNAPYQNTRSVVELAIGEMIVLMRGVFDKSNKAHAKIWDKSAKNSNEIRGKTLGIIGYGNIGSQLSVLAESLGMQVLFYDKVEKLALGNAVKAVSMDEVLKKSDVISVHVSGDRELNTNLIGDKEFSKMKEGVVFLNLARGFIVDIKALVRALKSGKIRGAGVDVFPEEPKSKDEPFISELSGLPNVILTPHIGGSTEEAQRNIAQFVSGKLIDFMNTGDTDLSVNFPNITLPKQGNAHRLLHIHSNVPGVMSQINKVFSDHDINILGQYLKTNDKVGYLITDVNRKYDEKVLEELKEVKSTINFRVLY